MTKFAFVLLLWGISMNHANASTQLSLEGEWRIEKPFFVQVTRFTAEQATDGKGTLLRREAAIPAWSLPADFPGAHEQVRTWGVSADDLRKAIVRLESGTLLQFKKFKAHYKTTSGTAEFLVLSGPLKGKTISLPAWPQKPPPPPDPTAHAAWVKDPGPTETIAIGEEYMFRDADPNKYSAALGHLKRNLDSSASTSAAHDTHPPVHIETLPLPKDAPKLGATFTAKKDLLLLVSRGGPDTGSKREYRDLPVAQWIFSHESPHSSYMSVPAGATLTLTKIVSSGEADHLFGALMEMTLPLSMIYSRALLHPNSRWSQTARRFRDLSHHTLALDTQD